MLHCWLGRSDPGLLAGGFLGDFIKGPIDPDLPRDLQRGIRLHRYIDAKSNQLAELRASYHRFGHELRRPAPILLDIVADHVLARKWDDYGEGDLTDFTRQCYATIASYGPVPDTARRIFEHMLTTDLFASYSRLDTVIPICHRILRRLKFSQTEMELELLLHGQRTGFEVDFAHYYPVLRGLTAQWINDN